MIAVLACDGCASSQKAPKQHLVLLCPSGRLGVRSGIRHCCCSPAACGSVRVGTTRAVGTLPAEHCSLFDVSAVLK